MTERKSKFRQNVETASWIVGILVGLLVIWQTLSPMFANKSDKLKTDSTKNLKADKTETKPDTSKKSIVKTLVETTQVVNPQLRTASLEKTQNNNNPTKRRLLSQSYPRDTVNSIKIKPKDVPFGVLADPGELTATDKMHIDRILSDMVTEKPSENNRNVFITIQYPPDEPAGAECAYQLSTYLKEKFYDVETKTLAYAYLFDAGFVVKVSSKEVPNYKQHISIKVGNLSTGERDYKYQ